MPFPSGRAGYRRHRRGASSARRRCRPSDEPRAEQRMATRKKWQWPSAQGAARRKPEPEGQPAPKGDEDGKRAARKRSAPRRAKPRPHAPSVELAPATPIEAFDDGRAALPLAHPGRDRGRRPPRARRDRRHVVDGRAHRRHRSSNLPPGTPLQIRYCVGRRADRARRRDGPRDRDGFAVRSCLAEPLGPRLSLPAGHQPDADDRAARGRPRVVLRRRAAGTTGGYPRAFQLLKLL